jgi:hypothetical protein
MLQVSSSDVRSTESQVSPNRDRVFLDDFSDERAPGGVIQSELGKGITRKGIDKEGVISIDNDGLRIQPLVKPGWANAGIAYGPYARRNGLAFAAFLLNGHNISRSTPLPDNLAKRLWQWVVGSETESPLQRVIGFVRSRQRRFVRRRLIMWFKTGTRIFFVPRLDENLAVGWFPSEAPTDPLHQGSAFLIHANIPEGGDLWARLSTTVLHSLRGLQNVPVYYLVVLREKGAAYYAASVAGVRGLPTFPKMRILAIDAFADDATVYAGVHQSVLGEIGFRADTRIYDTQVAELPEFGSWYGSAETADMLTGTGSLHKSETETGSSWEVFEGEFTRTARGAEAVGRSNTAVVELSSNAGLVHVLIETTEDAVDTVALVWRAQDAENFWRFEVGNRSCRLSLKEDGRWSRFASVEDCHLIPNAVNSLQVFDDGSNFRLYLNANLVYGTMFTDTRLGCAKGVGFHVHGGHRKTWLRSFEAHPREISAPAALALKHAWTVPDTRVVVRDDFSAAPGDLAHRRTGLGSGQWERIIGRGEIHLTGQSSARVVGSVERPCPGRTAYTIDWSNPTFADLEVTVTPPGTRTMMREKGRAGLIFWQDPDNYLILSEFIGDYPAMSVAAFFQIDGFEELYDAVWSNVGTRMHLAIPHDLRVAFDGNHFQAFINGEPVLYRALRDVYPTSKHFHIHRVGIVANWEWGNDTGSLFQNFVAREPA